MTMECPYSAAIIGCGMIAGGYDELSGFQHAYTHAGAYARHPRFTLAAASDTRVERLHEFQQIWKVPRTYEDYGELLRRERVDVLSVCVPDHLHYQVIQDALRPYRIQRWEGTLSILRRWSRKTRAWLVFTYEKVDISELGLAAQEQFRADSGISTTRSVTLAHSRDARDAPLAPTRGSVTTTELEYAGGPLGGDNHPLFALYCL